MSEHWIKVYDRVRTAGSDGIKHIRQRKTPLHIKIMLSAYHKYGLKHVLLLGAFVLYVLLGALIFNLIERPAEQAELRERNEAQAIARSNQTQEIMRKLLNNTKYYLYVYKYNWSLAIEREISEALQAYERKVIHHRAYGRVRDLHTREMYWNFPNAILYAGSICTTIGYGHIYAITTVGRILTMLYALAGIPLMLLLLQDMGQLLTVSMKYPWFQFKRGLRRLIRYCTSQSMNEIKAIEKEERANLYVFDLPVAVAVGLVILWMLFCCLILHLAAPEWGLVETFYFFFISLSTVGLGDMVPSEPTVLIWMFVPIIIGLSLVSMVINLIQLHLLKTYEAGRSHVIRDDTSKTSSPGRRSQQGLYTPTKQFSTLGVIQPNYSQMPHLYDEDDNYSYEIHPVGTIENKAYLPDASEIIDLTKDNLAADGHLRGIIKRSRALPPGVAVSRYTQTTISLPMLKKVVLTREGLLWVISDPRPEYCYRSPDEVINLVESDIDLRVLEEMAEMYEGSRDVEAGGEEPSEERQQALVELARRSFDSKKAQQPKSTHSGWKYDSGQSTDTLTEVEQQTSREEAAAAAKPKRVVTVPIKYLGRVSPDGDTETRRLLISGVPTASQPIDSYASTLSKSAIDEAERTLRSSVKESEEL